MTSAAGRQILFVGDMHLGRRPSGLPADLAESLEPGPSAAWKRCVRRAIELRVDAVALAGDLVQSENALFEAFGDLQSGVEELTRAGIAVCAVAGNHDTGTLPGLAALIPEFRLLGPGGSWSSWTLPAGADAGPGPAVRLVGWSFPDVHHRTSPLETTPPAADPGMTTFGLLHADLDASGSDYAPVRGADLRALNYAGWYLGHIHRPHPEPLPTEGEPFYLGSLSPLDPSETGTHGPLLVTVAADGDIRQRRLPLAPLRWEHVDWDAGEIGPDLDELRARLLGLLARRTRELGDELDEVQALGVRIRVVGRHAEPAALERRLRSLPLDELRTRSGRVEVFVQKITCEVGGEFDLDELARRSDPPGLLARRIVALERGAPEAAGWLRDARQIVEQVDRGPAYGELDESRPPDEDEVRRLLTALARRALAELLESTEEPHATP